MPPHYGTTYNVSRIEESSGRVALAGDRLSGSSGVSSSKSAVTAIVVPFGSGLASRHQ